MTWVSLQDSADRKRVRARAEASPGPVQTEEDLAGLRSKELGPAGARVA